MQQQPQSLVLIHNAHVLIKANHQETQFSNTPQKMTKITPNKVNTGKLVTTYCQAKLEKSSVKMKFEEQNHKMNMTPLYNVNKGNTYYIDTI